MKGWQVGLAAVLLCSLCNSRAWAATQSSVVFSEIQTGSQDSTAEDFAELYNQTADAIDLTTWRLEYHTTSPTATWTTKAHLLGSIPAHGHYLVASKGYLEDISDATFTSGLSKTGGSLRLVRVGQKGGADEVTDLVGWGKAVAFEGDQAAPSPADGQSLVRGTSGEDLLDSDQNGNDFALNETPTPQSETEPTEPGTDQDADPTTPGTDQSVDPGVGDQSSSPVTSTAGGNADVWITELLADPASPQTDTADEFIELFNPGGQTVDLTDYVLQTGLTYSHSYVISDLHLSPGQYQALYSADTKLSLSNSGSRARLVAPDGAVVYETPAYDAAKSGQAFALSSTGTWSWTNQPTPNSANIIGQPAAAPAATTAKPSATAKKTTSTKAKTPTTSKTSTAKLASSGTSDQNTPTSTKPQLQPAWLVGIGSVGVLYGAYEYREDIGNKFRQLSAHFKNRGKHRA